MKLWRLFALLFVALILLHTFEARQQDKKDTGSEKKNTNKNDDDDNDDGDYGDEDEHGELICEKDMPCTCDITEPSTIKCDHVLFEDDDNPDLTTANLKLTNETAIYKRVRIVHNRIRNLIRHKIVPKLAGNVEELDLSYNRIHKIESLAFDDFDHLLVLKLSHNQLKFETMKNVFTDNFGKTLDKLHLDYNKGLKTIPAGFFDNLGHLKELVLDGNVNLELTKETFGKNLENLETLSLDDCNIKDLPLEIFDKLPKLSKLSLSGNPFTKIPAAINKIPHLVALELSRTNIAEVNDKALIDDHQLQQLYMLNNKFLYMIDDCAFCGLKNISIIDFTNCTNLYSINANAFGSKEKTEQIPPNLKEISFENCNFTGFYKDLLNWEDLTKISISGNPLVCDCKLKWLLEDTYLHSFQGKIPTCMGPEEHKNKTFDKVTELVCPQSLNTRVFFLSFVFFVIVLAAIFGFIQYTRRRGRITNVFYRPELPQMEYNNLATNGDIMNEGYTYSLNQEQDRPEEDV